MGGKGDNLIKESGDDELNMLFRNTFNALLNNMVSILITYTSHDMSIKFFHHFDLLVQVNNLNCLKKSKHLDKFKDKNSCQLPFTK